ncbi:hypothetical protein [Mycolicibacterium alvei]|jgi:hypothetical protein|uniref:Secreted protein n=1 Tax=Mycolicibacterium alvei TaxID=67081 RepID=A0A6N4UP14_9MYCO|nr:hypothetical protein [Mycolicibacterium alvei]MCV7003408.1 hypothetical protein [Mycolicibacterium alvei]BBX25603.1 hypothetical protein MALV_07280 [Mycolicibacterium alvei]
MTSAVWRGVCTVLSAAVLAAGSMAVATIVTPAPSSACAPGETGVIYGCAPFCIPGRQLDTATGLCLPVQPPRTPNSVATPLF